MRRIVAVIALVLAGGVACAAETAAADPGSPLLALPRKLMDGGWPVAIQLLLSVVAGAYAIERFIGLRRKRIAPEGLSQQADALWKARQFDEIVALCDRHPSTLARVIRFIVRHRANPLADLSRACGDLAARDIRRHMQRAFPLAAIGMLEPLLGLLGTVLGMIETFAAVSSTGTLGDPTVLAGGISKFLVCTGTGLFIAVPCLMLYYTFKVRGGGYANLLEEEVDGLLHAWFMTREPVQQEAALAHSA